MILRDVLKRVSRTGRGFPGPADGGGTGSPPARSCCATTAWRSWRPTPSRRVSRPGISANIWRSCDDTYARSVSGS